MNGLKWMYWVWGGRLRRLFFMSIPENEKDYKDSRNMFIAADAMNQIIGNLAGGTYLMSLLAYLDVSDGAIGIILSLGALAAVFQLFILKFVQGLNKYKLYVVLSTLQRLWLGVLFLIPMFPGKTSVKAVIVVIMFMFGQIWSQTGNTVSVAWMSLLVPDNIRGSFLARKEAVAVFLAVFSTFCMGIVFDFFANREITHAFYINGGFLAIFALVNAALFMFMKDPRHSLTNADGKEMHGKLAKRAKKEIHTEKVSMRKMFAETFARKEFRKALLVTVMWNLCYFIACPFMSSYTIQDLGLSFTFVTLINLIATVLRVAILPFMGKLSDKRGAEMVYSISLVILMFSYILYGFTEPSNGIVIYCIAALVAAVGWSYIGAGLLNIQLAHMEEGKETEQFTILSGVAGLSAVIISVVSGKILDFLQQHRVVFAGKEWYAQQVLNFVGAICILGLILYVMLVIKKKDK